MGKEETEVKKPPDGRSLTNYEKETIIVFNEGEDEAHIFTYNKNWQQQIETRFKIKPDWKNGFGGSEYTISKKRIRIPVPKRELTPEQLERSRRRLASNLKIPGSKTVESQDI